MPGSSDPVSGRGARRGLAVAAVVALAAVLGGSVAIPAEGAGTSYRFWTYWHRSGSSWTYAETGPSSDNPADGSVEGWRYEVAPDGSARPPRASATFAQLCGSTPAVGGRIRVGIVLDYGTAADARRGQHPPASRGACARVAAGASGITALAAIASIRFRSDGLICAFDGYPSTGCVDVVRAPAPRPTAPTRSPTPTRPAPPAPVRTTAPPRTVKPAPSRTPVPTETPTPTETSTPTAPGIPPSASATTESTASDRAPSAGSSRRRARPTSPPATRSTAPRPRASTSSSARGPTSVAARPSGAKRGAAGTAVAASAATLVLTGTAGPGAGGPGILAWVGLAVVLALAALAVLATLRRRRRADSA